MSSAAAAETARSGRPPRHVMKASLRWLRALRALAAALAGRVQAPAGRSAGADHRAVADPGHLAVRRVYDLEQPCSAPCKTPASHTLIFDETYYVNAARVIDHIRPAAGATYAGAPLGMDPNAEHPQLAKVIIAGGIKLFGDTPKGWRLPSVLFGLIALVALYTLVIGLGGSGWLAVGATSLMALDNLLIVTGGLPRWTSTAWR